MKPKIKIPNVTLFERVMLIDCIFQQIQEFISQTDVNNLVNVVATFQTIKKSKYYLKLNRKYSLRYHVCQNFRARLYLLLNRFEKQLSLNLHDRHEVTDVSALVNVHTLNLRYCNGIADVSECTQ